MNRTRNFIIILFITLLNTAAVNAQLNTNRILAIGRNAMYFEDYVLSIQYFNQVIRIKPYLAEPYMYRAIAKTQLDDLASAEQDCISALELNPFLPGAYYTRGYIKRRQEKYADAERDFTAALEFSPENSFYLMNRADVRERQEKYDEALEDINFLLSKDIKSPTFHFEKGRISLSKKDTLTALNSFEQVSKLDPSNPAGWSALSFVNMQMKNDEQALENISRAISEGSKWAGDFINRGILYYKAHNYRGALADYDRAVDLDSQNPQCYYNRALLRSEVGDFNNALCDYNKVLELEPTNIETYYQRGLIHLELKDWGAASSDFEHIITRYPYFLPAYHLSAQAKQAIGDTKGAFVMRQKAYELEKNKEEIQKNKAKLNTDVQLAQSQSEAKSYKDEFSNRAAQNLAENSNTKYDSKMRGSVQNNYTKVINEPNFVLSYYAKPDQLRRTSLYHPAVEHYNKTLKLSSPLKLTNQEIALTETLINKHFAELNHISYTIQHSAENADLYFARAMEFTLVQDFNSAIEDLNMAIALRPDFMLAYFCRANVRYKLLEYISSTHDVSILQDNSQTETTNPHAPKQLFATPKSQQLSTEQRFLLEFEQIMQDYNTVIKIAPDFSYAYFNKANILCAQKDFRTAIEHYQQAMKCDADFAEAYYNCGLTMVYVDDVENGIKYLSKSGELGIYKVYNLISRFTK